MTLEKKAASFDAASCITWKCACGKSFRECWKTYRNEGDKPFPAQAPSLIGIGNRAPDDCDDAPAAGDEATPETDDILAIASIEDRYLPLRNLCWELERDRNRLQRENAKCAELIALKAAQEKIVGDLPDALAWQRREGLATTDGVVANLEYDRLRNTAIAMLAAKDAENKDLQAQNINQGEEIVSLDAENAAKTDAIAQFARLLTDAKAEIAALKAKCKYGDPACPCNDGDECNYEGENPMLPPDGVVRVTICNDELRIIRKDTIYGTSVPDYIRDRTGCLFFFRKVEKYDGQDERYESECKQMDALASYLLKSMLAASGGGKEGL